MKTAAKLNSHVCHTKSKAPRIFRNSSKKSLALLLSASVFVGLPTACSPETPQHEEDISKEMSALKDSTTRYQVAARIKEGTDTLTPQERLQELSRDTFTFVRMAVAANPKIPDALASELMRDANWRVRQILISNEVIPNSNFISLTEDHDWRVRVQASTSPKSSPKTLERLSRDKDPHVRSQLVLNPNTPQDVLGRLRDDGDNLVIKVTQARDTNTDQETLNALMKDQSRWVRQAVAANPKTPVKLLGRLVFDDSASVKLWLITNPSAPDWLLEELTMDPDYMVRSHSEKKLKERFGK